MFDVYMSWKCDWCGGALKVINGQVQCELCRRWHGKDGKAHNIYDLTDDE